MSLARTLILTLALIVSAMVVQQLMTWASETTGIGSVVAGDPTVYEERWQVISEGSLPYVQTEFEHFPLTLLPIAVAALLRDMLGIGYTAAYAIVSSLMVVATALLIREIGQSLEDVFLTSRFLIALAPLVPIALFRTDMLAVMCSAAAMLAAVRGSRRLSFVYDIGGIMSKGWPVVRVLTEWWDGRRARALTTLAVGGAVVGTILLAPGFRSGRTFEGVQIETMSGSAVLLARQFAGQGLEILERAGSLYIDVGVWAMVANLSLGIPLALNALRGLRAQFAWDRAGLVLAAVVAATLVASPLLSAQFLMWPVVYLVIARRARVLSPYIICGLLTTLLLAFWDPGELWWATGVFVRNLVLLWLAADLSREAARPPLSALRN